MRYRSRDHAPVVAMGCACGRTGAAHPLIGRTDDMLIYKGMNVFPTAIREVALAVPPDTLGLTIRIWKDDAAQVQFLQPIRWRSRPSRACRTGPVGRTWSTRSREQIREHLQVRVDFTVLPPAACPGPRTRRPSSSSAHRPVTAARRDRRRSEEAPGERVDA